MSAYTKQTKKCQRIQNKQKSVSVYQTNKKVSAYTKQTKKCQRTPNKQKSVSVYQTNKKVSAYTPNKQKSVSVHQTNKKVSAYTKQTKNALRTKFFCATCHNRSRPKQFGGGDEHKFVQIFFYLPKCN